MQANRNIRIVFFLCIAIALGMSLWIQAQELLPVSVHTAALRQSATPFSLFSENYSADLAASSVYVGSELCLACHSSFTPEAASFTFTIPFSYSLHAVYGADSILPSGDWNWQPLTEGTDYTVTNGVVTLLTTRTGVAPRNMIRIGLQHDF